MNLVRLALIGYRYPLCTSLCKLDFIMFLLNPIAYRPAGQTAVQRGNLSATLPSPEELRFLCKQENSRLHSKMLDSRFRLKVCGTWINQVEFSESLNKWLSKASSQLLWVRHQWIRGSTSRSLHDYCCSFAETGFTLICTMYKIAVLMQWNVSCLSAIIDLVWMINEHCMLISW